MSETAVPQTTNNNPLTENKRSLRLVLIMAVAANLLGNIGLTGLTMALPDMERSLKLSAVATGWVTMSIFTAMAAGAAPCARLADILGRRKMSLAGLALVIAGGLAGSQATRPAFLFASLAVVGLGLTTVFTNVTAMVTTVYPPDKRGMVLGFTTTGVYIGLSIGPLVCGFLVDHYGWPAVMLLFAFGMVPVLILMLLTKTEQTPASGEPFDSRGTILWITAVSLLFTGLTYSDRGWPGWITTAAGVIFMGLFFRVGLKAKYPVLDVSLFAQNRRFSFSSLAAFISYSSSIGVVMLLSLYLQHAKGLSAGKAGLVLAIQPVCQALVSPFFGRLSDRVDPGALASLGMAMLGGGLTILAFKLSADTSYATLAAAMAMIGVGTAMFAAPNSNAIISAVPPNRIGQASGTITATRLCGQVFSIAITTLVFSLIIGQGKGIATHTEAFIKAAGLCFKIFAPICLLGIAASLARGRKPKRLP